METEIFNPPSPERIVAGAVNSSDRVAIGMVARMYKLKPQEVERILDDFTLQGYVKTVHVLGFTDEEFDIDEEDYAEYLETEELAHPETGELLVNPGQYIYKAYRRLKPIPVVGVADSDKTYSIRRKHRIPYADVVDVRGVRLGDVVFTRNSTRAVVIEHLQNEYRVRIYFNQPSNMLALIDSLTFEVDASFYFK